MCDSLLVVPIHQDKGVKYEMMMLVYTSNYADVSKRVLGELFTKEGIVTTRINGSHVVHESREAALTHARAIAALDD